MPTAVAAVAAADTATRARTASTASQSGGVQRTQGGGEGAVLLGCGYAGAGAEGRPSSCSSQPAPRAAEAQVHVYELDNDLTSKDDGYQHSYQVPGGKV